MWVCWSAAPGRAFHSVEFSAPAKTNLSLRVVRRRDDGFHEIETLMVRLSLADTLHFSLRESGGLTFSCSDSTIPSGPENLVVRAVDEFVRHTGVPVAVDIHLEKKIPHGAGLGGGSSDAATTLIALNELYSTGLSKSILAELASRIGSDIPFFIHESAAWCRGRGEIVEPVAFAEKLPLFLIKPAFGVPTPWAYKQWRDSLEIPGIPYGPQEFAWGTMVNDLERPVFEKYIQLAEMKRWLLAQTEVAGALMSGSGSTMLALLKTGADRDSLDAKARANFGTGFWCCAVDTV
jgi:4-diphosphocytidyl-2-C-methyl-D-erythritol kinase